MPFYAILAAWALGNAYLRLSDEAAFSLPPVWGSSRSLKWKSRIDKSFVSAEMKEKFTVYSFTFKTCGWISYLWAYTCKFFFWHSLLSLGLPCLLADSVELCSRARYMWHMLIQSKSLFFIVVFYCNSNILTDFLSFMSQVNHIAKEKVF